MFREDVDSATDTSTTDTDSTAPPSPMVVHPKTHWHKPRENEEVEAEQSVRLEPISTNCIATRSQTIAGKNETVHSDGSTFIHFPRLPPEIRQLIWEYSREARYLKLHASVQTSGVYSTHIPPILHACSESRFVGLQHYRLAFGNKPSDARVWFDFDIDGLMLYCSEAVACPAHRIWWPGEDGEVCSDRSLLQRVMWEGPLTFQPMTNIAAMFESCVEAKLIRTPVPLFWGDVLYEDDFAVNEEALWVGLGRKSLMDYWLLRRKHAEKERNFNSLIWVNRVEVMSRNIGPDGKRVMETTGGIRVENINGRMVVSGTLQFGPLSKLEMKRAEENGTSMWGSTRRL